MKDKNIKESPKLSARMVEPEATDRQIAALARGMGVPTARSSSRYII